MKGEFVQEEKNRFGISSGSGKKFNKKDYENWLAKNGKENNNDSLKEYLAVPSN